MASQVRVTLKTKATDIQLSQDTGPILVSTELRRYQLSTLVNRLLETTQPIPLEFLINGQFLRTSLDDFLTQNGISAETALTVEYVKALIPPQHVASYEHDDWVSSIDVRSASSQSRILSASYDGAVRVWNLSAEVVATGNSHTAAAKCAKFMSPTSVVSSGVDRTLRVWKFADAEVGQGGSLTPALELYGHKASVDGLAVHLPSHRILSASADGRVGLWSSKKSEAPAAPENLLPSSNKRRKLSGPTPVTAPQRGPLSLLDGHSQQVSSIMFDSRDATVAYSASWDHAVKTWDLTTSKCVDTRPTAQSLFALCHLPEHSLLATGGALRYISLVDPRANATSVSAMTLRGHTNAVTSLSRDTNSTYQFVSGSNDGTCRIWDIRSAKSGADAAERVAEAVFVIERQSAAGKKAAQGDEPRVFSVCWDREVGIVSGGRDKVVQINKGS